MSSSIGKALALHIPELRPVPAERGTGRTPGEPETVERTVADDEPVHDQAEDDRSFSPTMRRLRPLVVEENRRASGRHPR